jgi:hypothetical protein
MSQIILQSGGNKYTRRHSGHSAINRVSFEIKVGQVWTLRISFVKLHEKLNGDI